MGGLESGAVAPLNGRCRALGAAPRSLQTPTDLFGRAKMVTIPACPMLHASRPFRQQGRLLNIHLGLAPLISLLAGILILVMPKLLNYIIAIYLIAIGLIGILGIHQLHLG